MYLVKKTQFLLNLYFQLFDLENFRFGCQKLHSTPPPLFRYYWHSFAIHLKKTVLFPVKFGLKVLAGPKNTYENNSALVARCRRRKHFPKKKSVRKFKSIRCFYSFEINYQINDQNLATSKPHPKTFKRSSGNPENKNRILKYGSISNSSRRSLPSRLNI